MKRTLHIMMVFLFLGSGTFTLPKCLLACPLETSGLKEGNKAIKEASRSHKPCCAEKNDAPQGAKRSVSCPILVGKSQPQATAGLLKTLPDPEPPAQFFGSFSIVSVYHPCIFHIADPPAKARSSPIIIEKQSLLI
jgi:hypothetical protein